MDNIQPDILPDIRPDIRLDIWLEIRPDIQPDIRPDIQADIRLDILQPDIFSGGTVKKTSCAKIFFLSSVTVPNQCFWGGGGRIF